MKLNLLSEVAPSDLMPDTRDPYLGAGGAEPEDELDSDLGQGPELEPEGPEPGEEELDISPEEPAPEEVPIDAAPELETGPSWASKESADRRDISFQRGDGFSVRMRKLNSSENKWLAQLYTDEGKILDKGYIDVPFGADPADHIISAADSMLAKPEPSLDPLLDQPMEPPLDQPMEPPLDQPLDQPEPSLEQPLA